MINAMVYIEVELERPVSDSHSQFDERVPPVRGSEGDEGLIGARGILGFDTSSSDQTA